MSLYSSTTTTTHQHHHQRRAPKIKLKCLVLGAAGAGKTSILRRYFYNKFDSASRVPTLGSDWYTARVPNPLLANGSSDEKDLSISLQMWDTPGRERFDVKQQKQNTGRSVGDSFFIKGWDAVMLVYDMTSSTSFKQLLKWYADLMEIRKRKHIPILVVANKLDLFMAAQQRAPHHPQRVAQRDVLGLTNCGFRGKDFRYEYQVSRIDECSSPSSAGKVVKKNKRMEISSYLADRENWMVLLDGSYLESLVTSEDASHPDRDMVMLWCMRNGLKHVEASAATGEGVDDAVRELIRLALESKHQEEEQQQQQEQPTAVHHPNKELDLYQRYAPKQEDRCCFLRPFLRWCR